MIRCDIVDRIAQIKTLLEMLEFAGWRLNKFVVVDEDQESLVVRLSIRYEPEKDEDVL